MHRLMLVSDVLNLPSIEGMDFVVPAGLAGDVIRFKELDNHRLAIMEQMRIDGINAVPIHVDTLYNIATGYGYDQSYFDLAPSALVMGNGHHRLLMARILGHKYIDTTDDVNESGWNTDPVIKLGEDL